MRPEIPTLQEVLNFIRKSATKEDRKKVLALTKQVDLIGYQDVLFDVDNDGIVVDKPNNQHELVLHTLIYPPKEISIGYWMEVYRTHKWSTRLGDVERILNITLVDRKRVDFVNRFTHKSDYMTYIPILTKEEYVELYNKIKSIKSKKKCQTQTQTNTEKESSM